MYPDEFDYHRAGSVEEAVDLLQEHDGAEIELLAGGHSLLPMMKSGLASPDVVVDISELDGLTGIETNGDVTTIGALTNYADIVEADAVRERAPVVAEAAGEIGDVQVRNMGTIGGNIAHADPASDLPGAALASDATLVARGPDGEREIDADDFFQSMYMTGLDETEVLVRVEIPRIGDDGVGAYVKKPSPSSGYALVGVAAVLHTDDGTVESARVAANGAMDRPVRLTPVEDALAGESLDGDAIEAAAGRAGDDLDSSMMMDDVQASSEFRAQLLEVFTERALERASERAGAAVAAE